MKGTKKALIVSGLSLAICFVLMSGMTFAWFTDSVINKNNQITTGTLTVDLLMDKEENGNYTSIANQQESIFSDKEGSNGYSWEPGQTEIVFLAVRNNGQLNLAYNIDLDIKGELASTLEYALIPDVKKEGFSAGDWNAVIQLEGVKKGDAGEDIAFDAQKEIPAGKDVPMSYFALAIHMKEDASNDVQEKSAEIDLTVNAQQVTTGNGGLIQP